MKLIPIIRKLRTPILLAIALAAIAYVVVVGFGDVLGVDPEFKAEIRQGAAWLWAAAITTLAPLVSRDDNKNGVPDLLESEPPPPYRSER